jgi:DNA-binding MarR family transcriptional regulator
MHRLTMSCVANGLKEHNVGSGQAMFLLELFHCDGIRQEELSKHLNIDGANTTRAIKKLVQEGYVERRPDPEDGRAQRIFLTERAFQLKPQLFDVLSDCEQTLLEGLSAEERKLFISLVKRIGHFVADAGRCADCSFSADCS